MAGILSLHNICENYQSGIIANEEIPDYPRQYDRDRDTHPIRKPHYPTRASPNPRITAQNPRDRQSDLQSTPKLARKSQGRKCE
jgi:hypothetical protein